jgi:CBS domain containing-hemolysin-like protein
VLIAGGLAVIVVLTLATGYFVAQEFAYVAVDRGRLRQLAREGDAAAERALRVTSRLSFTLSGAQFGITLTALLVGFAGEPLLGQGLAQAFGFTGLSPTALLSISVAFTLLFSTVLQMVLGELGPKNLAIARPVPLARALSRSTLAYLTVAGPVITIFDSASNALLRAVGIEPVEELPQGATPQELHRIISESHLGGQIDEDLSRLLGRGLSFRGHVAEEAMTPRIDVETVQADEPAGRVLDLLETGHARFPVIGRDIDDVIGVVGLHELLQIPPEDRAHTPVRDIAAEAVIIPESLPLPRVLERLRATHRQIAVVVDEYGGFAGVITFEDVAEEVVGEIWDEDDEHEDQPTARADGAWELHARLRMDEVEVATGIALPEDENYDTLSGLVMHRLGRMAQQGDRVQVEWDTRDEHGHPQHCAVRIDVLTLARHVPELVVVHQMVTGPPDEPAETPRPRPPVASRGVDEDVRG